MAKKVYSITVKSESMISTATIGEHPLFSSERGAKEYIKKLKSHSIKAHATPIELSDEKFEDLKKRGIVK